MWHVNVWWIAHFCIQCHNTKAYITIDYQSSQQQRGFNFGCGFRQLEKHIILNSARWLKTDHSQYQCRSQKHQWDWRSRQMLLLILSEVLPCPSLILSTDGTRDKIPTREISTIVSHFFWERCEWTHNRGGPQNSHHSCFLNFFHLLIVDWWYC